VWLVVEGSIKPQVSAKRYKYGPFFFLFSLWNASVADGLLVQLASRSVAVNNP
jgi:hypothetical protein